MLRVLLATAYCRRSGKGKKKTTLTMPANKQPVLPMPDHFNGTGDWSEWREHFEGRATLWEWTEDKEKCKWMGASFTGRAEKRFNKLPAATRANYALLCTAMESRYGAGTDGSRWGAELQQRTRRTDESVQSYADDVERLTDLAWPALAQRERCEIAKRAFIMGLNCDVREHVERRKPPTIELAIEAAIEEDALATRRTKAPTADMTTATTAAATPVVAAAATNTPLKEAEGEFERRIKAAVAEAVDEKFSTLVRLLTPGRSSARQEERDREERGRRYSSLPRRPMRCFSCNKLGHRAADCREKRTNTGRRDNERAEN